MALPGSGSISFSSIQTEFGGSNPAGINEYYRGGLYVPNISANASIPTSGAISVQDFYGSSVVTTTQTAATSPTPTNSQTSLLYVAFNNASNHLMVLTGQQGSYSSTNMGVSWTYRDTLNPNTGSTSCLGYGNGLFIAGSWNTSNNSRPLYGTASGWSAAATAPNTTSRFRAHAYGASTHVLAGDAGLIRTSSNGSTWTNITGNLGTGTTSSLVFGGSVFVAGGTGYPSSASVAFSSNGTTWSTSLSGTTPSGTIGALCYNTSTGLFYAKSITTNNSTIWTSSNGSSWSALTFTAPSTIQKIRTGVLSNGSPIFLGLLNAFSTTSSLYVSYNGSTWAPFSVTSARYADAVFIGGNKFFVVGTTSGASQMMGWTVEISV